MNQIADDNTFWKRFLTRYRFYRRFRHHGPWRAFKNALRAALRAG